MKKSVILLFAVAAAIGVVVRPAPLAAQAAAAAPGQAKTMKEMGDDHMKSGWKELDAFHEVMAAAWHPASKSNDLKVAREKAGALSEAAQKWAAAKAPASCDTKEIRDAIAAVVTGSKDFAQLAAKQTPDAELKKALSDVHTRFEVAEKGCQPHHKG